jgi:hypothetical protein
MDDLTLTTMKDVANCEKWYDARNLVSTKYLNAIVSKSLDLDVFRSLWLRTIDIDIDDEKNAVPFMGMSKTDVLH